MQEMLMRVEHVAPQESRVQAVACDEGEKLVLGVVVPLDHLTAGDRLRRPVEGRRVLSRYTCVIRDGAIASAGTR